MSDLVGNHIVGFPTRRRLKCALSTGNLPLGGLHRRNVAKITVDHGKVLTEPRCEKTDLGVSDLVRHKPACTVSEDGEKIEISDLGRREIVLF